MTDERDKLQRFLQREASNDYITKEDEFYAMLFVTSREVHKKKRALVAAQRTLQIATLQWADRVSSLDWKGDLDPNSDLGFLRAQAAVRNLMMALSEEEAAHAAAQMALDAIEVQEKTEVTR